MKDGARFFSQTYSRSSIPVSQPGVSLRPDQVVSYQREPSCPCCGSDRCKRAEHLPTTVQGGWRVTTCTDCGMTYTKNPPPPHLWGSFYPSTYPPYVPSQDRESAKVRWQQWRERKLLSLLGDVMTPGLLRRVGRRILGRRLDPSIFNLRGSGRLLDVGCGCGTYLARMAKYGWDATGVDRSEDACEQASAHFGVTALAGPFPNMDIDGKFDLVTAWQVVEHLDDPIASLNRMRELLAEDGFVVIAVPNFACWASYHFDEDWLGLDLPRHVNHFTMQSLEKVVNRAGLQVVHKRTVPHGGWIRHSARRAEQRDAGWKKEIFTSKLFSNLAATYGDWTGQADSLFFVCQAAK